jgi:hypothetical protein
LKREVGEFEVEGIEENGCKFYGRGDGLMR